MNAPASLERIRPQPSVRRRLALVARTTLRYPLLRLTASAGCGFPSPAADCADERVTLDEILVRRPLSSFLVEAEGSAMADAGILAGDILVIDRAAEPKNGSIVLASYQGELLIRKLRFDAKGRPELHAEDPDHRTAVIRPGRDEQFDIEGVAVGLMRELE